MSIFLLDQFIIIMGRHGLLEEVYHIVKSQSQVTTDLGGIFNGSLALE